MVINLIGTLYIVFVIKEVKPRKVETADKELSAMLSETKSLEDMKTEKPHPDGDGVKNKTGNMFINIIKDCALVLARKRSGNSQKIIYVILVISGLSVALDYGMTAHDYTALNVMKQITHSVYVLEYVNEYYFVRTKLNWEALQEAPYAAYSSASYFVGTTFMVTVLSKYFKVSDTILAILSSSFTAVSKFVCVSKCASINNK